MSNKKEDKGFKKIIKMLFGKTLADNIIRVILLVMAIGVVIYYCIANGESINSFGQSSFDNNAFNTNGFYSTSTFSNGNGGVGFGIQIGAGEHGGEGDGSSGGHGGE
ncbi:MAG: hypothetical protein ACRDDY_16290 [Clostridium sp.]|uniref:hypothetical protein n=1 Tax=Clostridium sp. TaxID=1506 RepID=UPI003EE71830